MKTPDTVLQSWQSLCRVALGTWVALGTLFIVSLTGCGPETKDVAENVPQSAIDGDGIADAQRDLDDAIPTDMNATTNPSSGPATEIDFSTWAGKDIEWKVVDGKEKELYADKDFTDQTAPNLYVQQWLSDAPEISGDKFLLIDFWATWCPPCRASIPELNAIASEFADELIVVGLSSESAEKVRAMEKPSIEYYSGIDPEARTDSAIGVQGIPHAMLIDPAGQVAWQGFPMGQVDPLNPARIREIIDQYHQSQ